MTQARFSAVAKALAASALTLALSACSGGSGTTTTAPTASAFSGPFVFSVTGSDSSDGDYFVLGRFVADGHGGITNGIADYNLGSGIDPTVPLVGTYTVAGTTVTVHLTDGAAVTDNLTITLADSGNSTITSFDGTGSGVLYPQVTTSFTPPGAYTYTVKGEGQGTITGSGNLTTGAANTFVGGSMSYQDGPTLQTYSTVSGFILPPQTNGRGQAALVGNNLAYYVINSKQIISIGLDEHSLLLVTWAKA